MTPADRSARALVTGEWRGAVAGALRVGLLLLTPLYRLGLAMRGLAYRVRILRVRPYMIEQCQIGTDGDVVP